MEEEKIIKRKRAATGTQIEKDLKQIYAANDQPIDLKTIDRGTSRRRWPYVILAVAALFVLAGVAWLGIMRFGGNARYSDRVTVTIEGPTAPRSGEAGTWTIRYKNDEGLPLARSELTLRVPASLTILSSEPVLIDQNELTWSIGTIEAGGQGTIIVKARILDTVDAPITVQAVLAYRPSNFNADFQKISSWSSRIADAAIEAKLEAPEEAVPGDDHPFTITITRRADLTADAALPDLKVRFDPERTLVVKKALPDFSNADERAWVSLPPTEDPIVFTAYGSFTANANGDTPVRAEVGTLGENGEFILLASATATVKVLQGDLVLTIINNGSTGDGTVDLGTPLHISLDYENKSDRPLNDVELSLTIAASPTSGSSSSVDWSTFDDLRKGKREANTITWTRKEIPDLSSIAPGAKGSIDTGIKIADAVFTTNDRNYTVDLSGRGVIGSVGDKKSGKTVSTPVIRVTVNSDALISAAAAHESGPLPPKNGETSSYRIVWVLSNSLHEISGIKATAALPAGVTYLSSGNVTAGDLRFDDGSRTVTWTLNRLPTSISSVSVDFTISITPGSGDIGKTLPFTSETTLSATDVATGAQLLRRAAAADTDIESEIDNVGIVQP